MSLCVENNFDILLTIDKNLINQQNIIIHKLTVVVLDSLTSKLEELLLLLPSFKTQVEHFEKQRAYIIEK